MKTKSIKFSIFTFLLLSLTFRIAAQDANLIFFDYLPQNNSYNPANQYDSTVIIFSPNTYFDIGTNTFGIKNTFRWNEEKKKKYFDLNYMLENSEDENFFYTTFDYSFLFIGKAFPKGFYTTFSINEKNNYNFFIPKDLFEFTLGNADYETETERDFTLDGLSVNNISYTSYTFGISKKFGSAFQFGLHLKLLNGKYVTKTRNFDVSLNTRQDFSEIYMEADINYQQSAPGLDSDQSGDFSFNAGNFSRQFFWHNNLFKNLGIAFDFGFTYSPDKKTTILGSVNDIGFINWDAEQRELHYKGSYNFEGFDLSPDREGYFDLDESFNSVIDSIENSFNPVLNDTSSFKTRLNSGIFLGFSRTINPYFGVFGLVRANIYSYYTDFRYTVGAIWNPFSKLSFSFSTSHKNNRIGNFGAGVIYRIYPVELFLSSENVEYLFVNGPSINFSFGINLFLLNVGKARN